MRDWFNKNAVVLGLLAALVVPLAAWVSAWGERVVAREIVDAKQEQHFEATDKDVERLKDTVFFTAPSTPAKQKPAFPSTVRARH